MHPSAASARLPLTRSTRPGLPARFRIAVGLGLFFVVLATLTRLALVVAGRGELPHSIATLGRIFAAGALLDLWVAAWCLLPWVLYLALLPERWWQARWQRVALSAALACTLFGALFSAAAEWFFFEEFDSRFNFVAVDYLLYPTEVVTNIWQSYPTGRILAALAALVLGLTFVLRRPLARAWERPTPFRERFALLCAHAGVLAVLALSVSPRPLVEHSPDRLVRELTSNGTYAFGEALLGLDAPYDGFYATRDETRTHERLEVLLAEAASTPVGLAPNSSARAIRAIAPEHPWNVVLLLEESLGSEFIGALHPGQDPDGDLSLTPEFDALAREGTLFTQAYATGNRTIRAIEATTSSLPPLPGAPIVSRRGAEDLFTLPGVLGQNGYQTLFVYGGRALFDGMGPYLSANGVQRIVEQSDFPADEFRTAWGVSDQAILDRALTEMDAMEQTGKPFFTMILSVSNHRPYAYPAGTIEPLPGLKRRQNVVRYADWAIGRFFRAAREKSYYDHTLFVVMGDHGARVYGAATIPLGELRGADPHGGARAAAGGRPDRHPGLLARRSADDPRAPRPLLPVPFLRSRPAAHATGGWTRAARPQRRHRPDAQRPDRHPRPAPTDLGLRRRPRERRLQPDRCERPVVTRPRRRRDRLLPVGGPSGEERRLRPRRGGARRRQATRAALARADGATPAGRPPPDQGREAPALGAKSRPSGSCA